MRVVSIFVGNFFDFLLKAEIFLYLFIGHTNGYTGV